MIARPEDIINEEIRKVEDKILKSPPIRLSVKKINYLIRIRAKIFEVGVVFTLGDLNCASLFFGLIEQESFNPHLGYEFKVKITNKQEVVLRDYEPETKKLIMKY